MQRIKLEAIEQQGDIGLRLDVIFADAAARYAGTMPDVNRPAAQPLPEKVVVHPTFAAIERQMATVEKSISSFPADVPGLILLFQQGRKLDEECQASPMTKRYMYAQDAVNKALADRGLSLQVY